MRRGFTLVELAIVITIIGLLIGGVLKGQELLENARMTSGGAQLKSYVTATIAFKDIYKAYPGDIVNPSNFIQNCTTAPCNISGNGNGVIGNLTAWGSDENNNYWLHLAKAGLISGFDPNTTWNSSTYFNAFPKFAMGGNVGLNWYNIPITAPYTRDQFGPAWSVVMPISGGSNFDVSIPKSRIAKYDLKFDDGRPAAGDVLVNIECIPAGTNPPYDLNTPQSCVLFEAAEFK